MSAPRVAAYALEHLVSEIAAFPLSSEAAFAGRVTSLDPLFRAPAGDLWRAAEDALLRGFPSTSVDEVNNLRDLTWFSNTASELPLGRYLRRLSARSLRPTTGGAIPVLAASDRPVSGREGEARSQWRWLAFALPPDLLVASMLFPGGGGRVQLVGPLLGQILADRGYAQTHLHLGAALEFPEYWVSCLVGLSEDETAESAFHSPGAAFSDGRFLGPWLLRAAVVRQLLARFLVQGWRDALSFWSYMMDVGRMDYVEQWPDLLDAVYSLYSAETTGDYRAIQGAYRTVAGLSVGVEPRTASGIQEHDPLAKASYFAAREDGGLTPEMQFVQSGLLYIEERDRMGLARDEMFEVLFWQVLRLRCILYRHVVQRPLTPGLLWFVRHYRRIRAGLSGRWSHRLLMEHGLSRDGLGLGLRSFECRAAPSEESEVTRKLVIACEGLRRSAHGESGNAGNDGRGRTGRSLDPVLPRRGSEEVSPVEVGIVLHFPRSRGGREGEGLFEAYWLDSHASPAPVTSENGEGIGERDSRNPNGYRYQSAYTELQRRAFALARLLVDWPLSLLTVRGVDVCTDEVGMPTWVVAPMLRFVREASQGASEWLRGHLHVDVPSLRATAHVGEDYVHLLGGLRRVDEAIRFFRLSEGDRLGHGLAIGVDPVEWSRRTGSIALAKEDRLFDLAWEWQTYRADSEMQPCVQRLVYICAEVERISKDIFGAALTPLEVSELVEGLHDETVLMRSGFPHGPVPVRKALVARYLTDPVVFMRGRDLMLISVQREGEVLCELQKALRRKIGRLGLTVEVNPSSNLLIGDLSDLQRHPMWRLNPVEPIDGVRPIAVCIGSDDPLTFATSLRQEYQLLMDALVQAGRSEDDAAQWVDRVRENGLRARFTLPVRGSVSLMNYPGPTGKEPRPMP